MDQLKAVIAKKRIISVLPGFIKEILKAYRLYQWYRKTNSSPPAPHFLKQSILLRHSIENASWIETGTFMGDTTKILAQNFPLVHTIEPSKHCLEIAKKNIGNNKNVTYHEGTSEDCFDRVCSLVSGDVCFWLDGHYSGGITYQSRSDTPIEYELKIISKYLKYFRNIVILIDDIRCSHIDINNYPSLNYYVDWANSSNLNWVIENDIFIIKSKDLNVYSRER